MPRSAPSARSSRSARSPRRTRLACGASFILFAALLAGHTLVGCGGPERDLHEVDAGVDEAAAPAPTDASGTDASGTDASGTDEVPWKSNRLAWTTASEVENFGYDIYRGDTEEGPFERITEQPIPGHGTTDEPSDYVYYDETIEPGTVYWYYVESISVDGVRERFTPIFPSKPKYAPGTEPAPEAGAEPSADEAGDETTDEAIG